MWAAVPAAVRAVGAYGGVALQRRFARGRQADWEVEDRRRVYAKFIGAWMKVAGAKIGNSPDVPTLRLELFAMVGELTLVASQEVSVAVDIVFESDEDIMQDNRHWIMVTTELVQACRRDLGYPEVDLWLDWPPGDA